jgi:ribosome-binding protein aMBF1 (putative translation factor)
MRGGKPLVWLHGEVKTPPFSHTAEFVEIKLALARRVRELREEKDWSQAEFARLVGSSQSRVAKMEAADPTER